CGNCGLCRFPATRFCPQCRSETSEWHAVAPIGIVETWCTFHRPYFDGLSVPYTVIQVRLDCSVRLFSNPVEVEAGSLHHGMPGEAVFEDITPDVTPVEVQAADGIPMKAMVVRAPGGTEVLKIEQIPDPSPTLSHLRCLPLLSERTRAVVPR